jgi:hypothetical protein
MSACATKPEPCNCSVAETELRMIAVQDANTAEDLGNIRQQLKACQEKH